MLAIRPFDFASFETAIRAFGGLLPRRHACENWSCQSFSPEADIREEENKYLIEVDLPGLTEKDIQITLENNHLSLKGERNTAVKEEYIRRERCSGSFERLFKLPDNIDAEHIEAKAHNGVLRISVPKSEKVKPKTIPVIAG